MARSGYTGQGRFTMDKFKQFLRTPGREFHEVESLVSDNINLNQFWNAIVGAKNYSMFVQALRHGTKYLPEERLDGAIVDKLLEHKRYDEAAQLIEQSLAYTTVPDEAIADIPDPGLMKQTAIRNGHGLLLDQIFKHHDLSAQNMDFDYAVRTNATTVAEVLVKNGSYSNEVMLRIFVRSTKRLFRKINEFDAAPQILASFFATFAAHGLPNYDRRYGRAHHLSDEDLGLGSPHELADRRTDDAPSSCGFVFATYRSLDDAGLGPSEEAAELLAGSLSGLLENGHTPRQVEFDNIFEWSRDEPIGGRGEVLKTLLRHYRHPDRSQLKELINRPTTDDWNWDELLSSRARKALRAQGVEL